MKRGKTLTGRGSKRPVGGRPTVIVAGGGPGGCGAALGAARAGARVVLIERYGFLGGSGAAALVHPWMTYHAGASQIVGGVFEEVVRRLRADGAFKDSSHFGNRHHCFDPEYLKFTLQEMLLAEGVELKLHTLVVDALMDGARIRGLVCESKSGREAMAGDAVVDCTGDADVCSLAGAPWEKGREDGGMQPATLHFRMGGARFDRMPSRERLNALYASAKRRGLLHNPRENLLWFDTTREGEIHFNTTRVLGVDGTDRDSLTRGEIESRRQVMEIVRWIVKEAPGFEDAYLLTVAPQIGIRESRRVVGEYVLTGEDVLGARKFRDGIALGSYCIDIHNPSGAGTTIKHLKPGEYYSIPYRCLVPKKIEGLLVAGRPISATHEAHSSVRIQPISFATGQAAGAAAALAALEGRAPRDLQAAKLRKTLLEQGALLRRRPV